MKADDCELAELENKIKAETDRLLALLGKDKYREMAFGLIRELNSDDALLALAKADGYNIKWKLAYKRLELDRLKAM